MWFIKEYFLGYLLIMIAAQGYSWYYLSGDTHPLWFWLIFAIVGLILLVHKNIKKVPDSKKIKVILFDVIYITLVSILVSIPSPFLAWVISAFPPLFIIQYAFKPFGNKDRGPKDFNDS
ncbi:hypothetical protein [Evansella cellulosilytica]|uniref:Uncharacterized protein n=1 Tax=Evansella cellulosilytica (strain ATCC 21833 / DSM 2522 / FERM P-1141 / JCM 9156 / N-4) TaxID=649639 RepID=E6TVN5_EVAC2|nr:hypothetical protein [Evansella cellulosilytica]ADU32163.1 hypothetical protein Bcell_3928 [Evansella cellulosilytica DSM 2522]